MLSSACSSYQLNPMSSRSADVETTGSIQPAGPRLGLGGPQELSGAARAAVNEALGRSGTTASVPWEDPATGARGTVTPLSNAYTQDGTTCRDFLASFVRNGAESWLQGEACRSLQGRWDIRQVRPWRRT